MFQFHEPGKLVDGDLELILVDTHPGNPALGFVPSYRFAMTAAELKAHVGGIRLRVGSTPQLEMYFGHIGYNVMPAYRGQRYAARSVNLLRPLMLTHGMETLWITCDPDNLASRRTCEIVGARLIEIVELPEDTDLYRKGHRRGCRYRLDLAVGSE